MTKVSMFVKLKAHEGRGDEVLDALRTMLPSVEDEPGTEVYSFHRERGDDDAIWVYELYSNDVALAEHGTNDALGQLMVALDGVLAEPPLMVLADLAAGKGHDG